MYEVEPHVMDSVAVMRLVGELRAALRRRPANEARLAGTLRAVCADSPEVLSELVSAAETVARRGSFERPLYAAAVRSLSEQGEARLIPVLVKALSGDEAGGLSSLAAACFTSDGSLSGPLSRAAMNRHPVVAFTAEVARLTRGEPRGDRIASLAPKIKEAHRIALCSEVFVSLLARSPLPAAIAPGLAVLRDAERHLGRWLLLGELASRAGDAGPLAQARERAQSGPASARTAWQLVAWALDPRAEAPTTRPTVELISRLSDRPSAERDATFLFRMAKAKAPGARPLLEGIARGATLGDEVSVRAALHLCRDYGEEQQVSSLANVGKSPRRDGLRALAAAALYDCGRATDALEVTRELQRSRQLPAVGWTLLIHSALAGSRQGALVSELNFRRVQQGSCE